MKFNQEEALKYITDSLESDGELWRQMSCHICFLVTLPGG